MEADIRALISEISAQPYADSEILTAAAYFHARFEYIHPFADGNGRVGRTLLNYFLILNNHPPIIIHNDDKQTYYNSLNQYDTTENLTPLSTHLKSQTKKTWEKSVDRGEAREAIAGGEGGAF